MIGCNEHLAKVMCRLSNGRDGCRCPAGQSCDAMGMTAATLAAELNITIGDLEDLATGSAGITRSVQRRRTSTRKSPGRPRA